MFLRNLFTATLERRKRIMNAERNGTSFAPTPPQGVHYLPGEAVLLLMVALPSMSAAQRRASVGFAVEDQIAAPLDEVHVMLGPPIGDKWLVVVIARDLLARIRSDRKVRVLPDTLALPVPENGHWSVWSGGDRALVRTADGAGFATTAAALPIFHLAAGHPPIILYGGTLDQQFASVRPAIMPTHPHAVLDRLDLGLARDGVGNLPLPKTLLRMAAVLAFAAVGHIGLLATDIWALGHIRAEHQTDVRGVLNAMGQPASDDLDAAIIQTLARANGANGPRLIPMMSQTFAALDLHSGHVTLNDLQYAADQGTLALTLQAPDIVTLQSVEVALKDAGFRVTAGAATTASGLAEQQLTLLGGST
jgi:general secretion pathway protein L